jgi:hypothetical protein
MSDLFQVVPCKDCPRSEIDPTVMRIARRITKLRKSGMRGSFTLHLSPDSIEIKTEERVLGSVKDK